MRRWLVVAAPFVLLAVDWAREPRLFRTQPGSPLPSLTELMQGGPAHLGRLNGHEFFVSFDTIRSNTFLECCRDQRNAIIVSRWRASGGGSQTGAVGRAVRSRLNGVDSSAHARVVQSLLSPGEPGSHECVEVSPGDTDFPIHGVYLVTLAADADIERRTEWWQAGFGAGFRCARGDAIQTLVLPAIGIDPNESDPPFTAHYEAAFAATPNGGKPTNVRLSWYRNWDTRILQAAHNAIEALQGPTFSGSLRDRLQNPMIRLACLAFALCFLSASRRANLTPLRWLALTLVYAGAFGAAQGLLPMVYAGEDDVTFLTVAGLTLILAWLFPLLATADLGKALRGGQSR